MTEKQISTNILTLSQKKDKSFYTYYRWIETLLVKICEKNWITHNRENLIVLYNGNQYILKNTIAKFYFHFQITKFCLHIIEYKTNLIYNFNKMFKKTKAYFDILSVKAQI